jgi:hypothetical protein
MAHTARTTLGARGIVALLTIALLLTPAVADAQEVDTPTNDAVEWLIGQLTRGDHLEDGSGPLYGPTADVGLALVSSRRRLGVLTRVVEWMSRTPQVDAYVHGLPYEAEEDASPAPPVDDPTYVGANAKLGLLVTLAARDPRSVAGDDLVENMLGLEQPSGAFEDRARDGNFANVYGQAFAILFLDAADDVVPSDASIDYLIGAQCPDGGFPETFDDACTSSVDATGLALQALVEAAPADAAARAAAQDAASWLQSSRNADGSWGSPANINSTGYAGMGVLAAGDGIDLPRLFLREVQNPNGGLPVSPGGASNALATAQALPLLAGTNYVDPSAGRIADDTRITTAIEVSQSDFAGGQAGAVVLTRSDLFADALAGTPLAVALGGPLLITDPSGLLDEVLVEIERVLPDDGEVVILGGTAALPSSVDQRLRSAGLTTRRVQGATRFETSVAIARELGDPELQLLTTGLDFPDALAAGAAAGTRGGAVLLTEGDSANAAVSGYLDENPGERVAVGGPASRAHPEADAVVGGDRTETAVRVARRFFDAPPTIGVARSDLFADALSGGVHQARRDSPLVLTASTELSGSTSGYICDVRDELMTVDVFGGPAAVTDDVLTTINARLAGTGC